MELGGDRTHNAAGVEERNAHSGTTPQHLRIYGGVVVDRFVQRRGCDWIRCSRCGSDVNGDGLVGVGDLMIIRSVWADCLK